MNVMSSQSRKSSGHDLTSKLKSPLSDWTRNRTSLMIGTTLVTTLVFSMDKFFHGDGGLWFYVLGFGSAYLYLHWDRALPKGRGVSKMKQHSFISERHDRVPQPKAKPSFGGMKPSTADLRESQLAAPVADSECAAHQVGSPSSKSKDQKGNTAKLNYAINQSAMRGDPAKTQDLLTNLENSGLESDATSYNLLMRAFCKANDIAGAEKVLE